MHLNILLEEGTKIISDRYTVLILSCKVAFLLLLLDPLWLAAQNINRHFWKGERGTNSENCQIETSEIPESFNALKILTHVKIWGGLFIVKHVTSIMFSWVKLW